jgi:hypothetical protein
VRRDDRHAGQLTTRTLRGDEGRAWANDNLSLSPDSRDESAPIASIAESPRSEIGPN